VATSLIRVSSFFALGTANLELLSQHVWIARETGKALRYQSQRLKPGKSLDSTHLACAETAGCERFLTCDDRLLR